MPYTFHDDIAVADVAYEATGKTLEEMFVAAALAMTETQVKDLATVEKKEKKEIQLENESIERLLHDFLQELIYEKDANLLLFSEYKVKIEQSENGYQLKAVCEGEKLDMQKHELLVDVKAVSWHMFEVKEANGQWKAFVILDV